MFKAFLIAAIFISAPLQAKAKEDSLGEFLLSIFEDYKSIEDTLEAEVLSFDNKAYMVAVKKDSPLIKGLKSNVLKDTQTLLNKAYKKGKRREINELIIFKWTTILKRSKTYDPSKDEREVLKGVTLKNSPSIEKLITALSFQTAHVISHYSSNIKGPIGSYLTALAHFKKAELKEAKKILNTISPDDDILTYALLLKAQIYFLENGTAKSIEALEEVIYSSAPDIIKDRAKIIAGQVCFEAGLYKKARNYFDSIEKSSPLYYEARLASIWAMEKNGDHLSALLLLKKLKENKDFSGDYLDLASAEANIYMEMEKFIEALTVLTGAKRNRDELEARLLKFKNKNDKATLRNLVTAGSKSKASSSDYLTQTLRQDMSISKELITVKRLKVLKRPYDKKIKRLSVKTNAIEKSIAKKNEFKKSINLKINTINDKLKLVTDMVFFNKEGRLKLKPLSEESKRIEKTISSKWAVSLKRKLTPMERLFTRVLSFDLIESQKCTGPVSDCPFYEGIKNKTSFNKSIAEKIVRDLFSVASNKKIFYKAKSKNIAKILDEKIEQEAGVLKSYNSLKSRYRAKSSELKNALNATYSAMDDIIDARLGLIEFELKGTDIKIKRSIKDIKELIKLSSEK